MAEIARFFNAVLEDGVYDRRYSSADLAAMVASLVSDGVMPAYANALKVSASSEAGMTVNVATGAAFIKGRMYENTTVKTLPITTAPSTTGYKRIDRIVVRLSLLGRTISLAVKPGTAAVSPSPPSLTRSIDDIWEISLAQVLVSAGVTAITAAVITDERAQNSVCGFSQWMVTNADFSSLYTQFAAQFQDWFEELQVELSGDVATNLQRQIDNLKSSKGDKALYVDMGSISSLPVTKTVSGVTTDMVCVQAVLGTPAAQQNDWTINTDTANKVTVSGSISGTTSLKVILVPQNSITGT